MRAAKRERMADAKVQEYDKQVKLATYEAKALPKRMLISQDALATRS